MGRFALDSAASVVAAAEGGTGEGPERRALILDK